MYRYKLSYMHCGSVHISIYNLYTNQFLRSYIQRTDHFCEKLFSDNL